MNLDKIELDDTWKEIAEAENQKAKQDKEVLDAVKAKVTEGEYTDILYAIEMSDNTYDYLIADKPKGKFQHEDEFEHLKGEWVDQTTNGGYTGDDFAGTVSIEIGKNEYFQYSYWM